MSNKALNEALESFKKRMEERQAANTSTSSGLSEYEVQKQQIESLKILRDSGVAERFLHSDFSNFTALPETNLSKKLEFCARYSEALVSHDGYFGNLVFCGPPGNGKTHLGISILKRVLHAGKTGYYSTLFKLLSDMKDFKNHESEAVKRKVVKADFLVLDEVNSPFHSLSETDKNMIMGIFNSRYEQNKPTLVITNYPYDKLPLVLGGPSIIGRLFQEGENCLTFSEPDYRMNKQ